MAEKRTIARPYAQAVFQLAEKQQRLAEWSETLQLLAAIAADPAMQTLVNNPRVSASQLAEVFHAVGGEKQDAAAKSLINILVENGRISLLAEIASLYESYRAEAEKVVQAEVIAAYPVSDEQQAALAAALRARLGRDVSISCRTDDSLIGGAIIRAGDMVIDGSLTGQLNRLSQTLLQ